MINEQNKSISKEHISPYNDQELAYFRQIILDKRTEATRELEALKRALQEDIDNINTKVTNTSHMADVGTDAREREKIYMLHNRTRKFISYLDRALQRIDNKTYGICKATGEKISKGRLEAVPHTQLSIEAKKKQR
ncbi:TraR/DksA C4-type zinc finger protein [Aliifodinibius sp. S!AR15-10]|uniref:TraR/DksA family transcriptional regulator n=1 Tax=Aliifodinibius sp. S!AR15-10 TaxID=2950437 RepID=UPI002865A494|nr:TraR/DksA C4-type zinc finger protein [Aliifodinibius sp. S!AR15-10]MDR8394395.1 TraR/DksA C4-type zinc finger protein [Aliifodinibius sp. S!AR15-10]